MTDAAAAAPPRRRRAKPLLLVAGILLAAVVFGVGTQTWVTVAISGAPTPVTANATTAAPALSALALAQLALVGALALAGPVVRYVLAGLQVLLGAVMALSVASMLADPLGASTSAVAKATGVSGHESVARLATDVQTSGWPVVALVGSVLFVLVGVGTAVSSRRWPGPSRRYETAPGAASTAGAAAPTRDPQRAAVEDWDALSHGDDPTDEGR